jgi:hypothetical protein
MQTLALQKDSRFYGRQRSQEPNKLQKDRTWKAFALFWVARMDLCSNNQQWRALLQVLLRRTPFVHAYNDEIGKHSCFYGQYGDSGQ